MYGMCTLFLCIMLTVALFTTIIKTDRGFLHNGVVDQTLNKHCYLEDGLWYAERFYVLTTHQTAVYQCGVVLDCETECNAPMQDDNAVYVYGYVEDNSRIVDKKGFVSGIMISVAILALAILVTVAISMTAFFLIYANILEKGAVHSGTPLIN